MRLKGLDLNLLVALDVLLDERSVSRAAERLHVSQPAASAALGRLRDYFGDDLLVQHGIRMIPTSFAESIHATVKRILEDVDGVISMPTEFDPARSDRVYRLMASDYITTVLLAPLLSSLEHIAPNVRFDIRLPDDVVRTQFERGTVDLCLVPENHLLVQHPAELVFEEPHVIVGWSQNPLFNRKIGAREFYRAGHIGVRIGPGKDLTFTERQLESLGKQREMAILAQSFTVVPRLLIGSHRLAVMQQRLAEAYQAILPLKIAPLPFDFKSMRLMAQYHSAREADAGLRWLINEIHRTAAGIVASDTH